MAECFCGSDIEKVTLPPDLARQAGEKFLWVHTATRDLNCYPDDENEGAIATPYSGSQATQP